MKVPFIQAWLRMLFAAPIVERARIESVEARWEIPTKHNTNASPNGRDRSTVAKDQRAARKAKNRIAHRKACK